MRLTASKPGFTLLEIILTLAVIGIVAAMAMPLVVGIQNRNELDVATHALTSALYRAQMLSIAMEGDSSWGVKLASGTVTVFRGDSYATRSTAHDEGSPISAAVVPSGLSEVVFSKRTGDPQQSGTFTLTSVSVTRSVTLNAKGTFEVLSMTSSVPPSPPPSPPPASPTPSPSPSPVACSMIPPAGSLPAAVAGSSYSQSLTVTPSGTYSFQVSQGNLAPGLSLDGQNGLLSGTTTVVGDYSFGLSATGSGGTSCTQSYSLSVTCPSISLGNLALPTLGAAYSQTLSAQPAGGNYSYAVSSGVLPMGLSLNPTTGLMIGTPSQSGPYAFTISASGFGSCAGYRTYTGTVGSPCPSIALPNIPSSVLVSQLYNGSLTASPSATYTYAVTAGSIPPGVTFYPSFGLLFGYANTVGTYSFTITATDAQGCSGSRSYLVTVTSA